MSCRGKTRTIFPAVCGIISRMFFPFLHTVLIGRYFLNNAGNVDMVFIKNI
jgi:hypothetical protein